ncbi:MAG: hypothetical protein HFJ85_01750 [Oscillospiraceae bacterium]|nr:hypothetical protein [Oscillospiraceae bacterium]
MRQDGQLLNKIYQDTKMGEENINVLLKSVGNTKLRSDLITQMEGYATLNIKAKKQIYENRENPVEESFWTKLMAGGMIRVNAAMASTPDKIARMMIEGSTMGIVEAKKALNRCKSASRPARKLAGEVITFEQNNIERLKEYL